MIGETDARGALTALAAGGVRWSLPSDRVLRHPERARRSGVLVLFGERGDTGPARDGTVGVDGLDVLLLRRASTLRQHAGEVGFPGGVQEEQDADLTATALREAVEETGVDPSCIEVLAPLAPLPIPVSRSLVTPVLAWRQTNSPVSAVDPAETAEVFRIPVARLLEPANRVNVERVGDHRIRPIPAFQVDDRLIWGFTAIVLSGLFDALDWAEPWDASRRVDVSR